MNIVNNTMALFHFNDPENPLKDELGNLKLTLNSGSATITTDHAKFGKCCNLSGAGITSNEFRLEKNITIDFWCYLYTNSYYENVIFLNCNQQVYSSRGIIRYYSDNSFYTTRSNQPGSIVTISNLVNNNLSHIAIVIDDNVRIYVNGNLSASTYRRLSAPCDAFISLGCCYSGGGWESRPTYDYISELRISNISRYTDNFIPPDKPYDILRNHKIFHQDKSVYGLV